ncbi:MAG TPA: hypothetical protein VKA34_03195, partial [Balneolales bacterium]|nr:hypothetical protein [Balneolales bacterium]
MGDVSEYRGLIIIGTFITLLVAMLAVIPNDFYVYSESNKAIQFESGFNPRGIFLWNSTKELAQADMEAGPFGSLYENWGKDDFGHHMTWGIANITGTPYIYNQHYNELLILFRVEVHEMEFINKNG